MENIKLNKVEKFIESQIEYYENNIDYLGNYLDFLGDDISLNKDNFINTMNNYYNIKINNYNYNDTTNFMLNNCEFKIESSYGYHEYKEAIALFQVGEIETFYNDNIKFNDKINSFCGDSIYNSNSTTNAFYICAGMNIIISLTKEDIKLINDFIKNY